MLLQGSALAVVQLGDRVAGDGGDKPIVSFIKGRTGKKPNVGIKKLLTLPLQILASTNKLLTPVIKLTSKRVP